MAAVAAGRTEATGKQVFISLIWLTSSLKPGPGTIVGRASFFAAGYFKTSGSDSVDFRLTQDVPWFLFFGFANERSALHCRMPSAVVP